MQMSITDAQAHLADLVARAEAGEEVVLTRDGVAVARVSAVLRRKLDPEEFDRLILQIQEAAAKVMLPGPSAARSQDFLYDENGLPI